MISEKFSMIRSLWYFFCFSISLTGLISNYGKVGVQLAIVALILRVLG